MKRLALPPTRKITVIFNAADLALLLACEMKAALQEYTKLSTYNIKLQSRLASSIVQWFYYVLVCCAKLFI